MSDVKMAAQESVWMMMRRLVAVEAERDALKAENRALRGLLKECRKVVKSDTILRRSLPHIDLCKRISKATGGGK